MGKHFGRWLAFAICDSVQHKVAANPTNTLRTTTSLATPISTSSTRMPKWRRLLSGLFVWEFFSPRTFRSTVAVNRGTKRSATTAIDRLQFAAFLAMLFQSSHGHHCLFFCRKSPILQNYSVLFSPDPTLPFPSKWTRKPATCRDSFGFRLERLPTNAEYTACVLSNQKMAKIETSGDFILATRSEFSNQCDRAWLSRGMQNFVKFSNPKLQPKPNMPQILRQQKIQLWVVPSALVVVTVSQHPHHCHAPHNPNNADVVKRPMAKEIVPVAFALKSIVANVLVSVGCCIPTLFYTCRC